MDRLPKTRQSTDSGFIYVVKRENAYKIGFSRSGVARRVRESGGELLFTIPSTQRPAQLEYLINNRFAAKRLPAQGIKPGDKREWFALDAEDLAWLRGFSRFMGETLNTKPCARIHYQTPVKPLTFLESAESPAL